MEGYSSPSVRELVGVFELANVSPIKVNDDGKRPNRLTVEESSDDGNCQISPKMTKYRDQLQAELEELLEMKNKLEGRRTDDQDDDGGDVNSSPPERSGPVEGTGDKTDAIPQTFISRAKVVYSSSTISGARARRILRQVDDVPKTSYIDNIGIVCGNKAASESLDDKADKAKKNQVKLSRVLQEFVSSEKIYIKRLAILDDTFRKELSQLNMQEYLLQWDSWDQMFSNIGNIHKFHSVTLLPRLEECLASHSDHRLPRCYIGKVFSDLAPYLKMYSEYAQNYKKCLQLLDMFADQSPRLQQFIQEFEGRDICEGLKVRYFYIEPIQRIPRYELLLREYTSCLSDDSEDIVNSHIALKLVKQANIHSNNSIKNEENFFRIREIEDSLRDSIDLWSPTRKFIKAGDLEVILPVCGRTEERRLFLFNDLLLVCQYFPHPFRPPFCISERMDITKFQVKEVRDRIFLFGPQTIVELLPRSPEDRLAWKMALDSVTNTKGPIERFSIISPDSPAIVERLPSLKKSSSTKTRPLGTVAPVMIKEQNVQSCMECSEEFGLFNRKRSCFACGRVVCKECSEHKSPLAYVNFEIKRVCNKCHDILDAAPNFPKMF